MAENYFGLTDTGKTRDNNEDTFIAGEILNNRYTLACVIDGVGGYNGGEVAAKIAHDVIVERMENMNDDVIPSMINAFKEASSKIYQKRQQDKEHDKMACVATLVIADIQNNQFYYAHVGDTRLYLLRDGSLIKISHDHSFVGFLEDSGRLTEREAMKHIKRNEINKALGFSEQIDTDDSYIETGQSPFLPGDMLLLCSDGLTDMVDKNEITQLVTQNTSLQQKATALINAANNNGGSDNITVVLAVNNKAPQNTNATRPATITQNTGATVNTEDLSSGKTPDKTYTNVPYVRKNGGLIALLVLICLALAATSVWLYLQWQKNQSETQPIIATAHPQRNEQELLLQDAFNNTTGDTLILSDTVFKSPVIISDTLRIKADTLYIKANGNIVLQRDTAYHGPALLLTSANKVTVLDSLQFTGFSTAVYVNNTLLYLKNVRFANCTTPVINAYTFAGSATVTARLPVLVYPIDSSANKRVVN